MNQKDTLYCNRPSHEGEPIQGLVIENNNIQVYCHQCYKQQNREQPTSKFVDLQEIKQISEQYSNTIEQVKKCVKDQQNCQITLLKNLWNQIESLIIEIIQIKDNTIMYLDDELKKLEWFDYTSIIDLGLFISTNCIQQNNTFILQEDKINKTFLERHQLKFRQDDISQQIDNLLYEIKQTFDHHYYLSEIFYLQLGSIAVSQNIVVLEAQNGEILIYKDGLLSQKYSNTKLRVIKMEIQIKSQEQQYVYVLNQNGYNEYSLHRYDILKHYYHQFQLNLSGDCVDFKLFKDDIYYNCEGQLIKAQVGQNCILQVNEPIYKNIKAFDIADAKLLRLIMITDENDIIYHLFDIKNNSDLKNPQLKIEYQNQNKDDLLNICKFIDPFKFIIGGQFQGLLIYQLQKSDLILKYFIKTDFYCQYIQANEQLLVYSNGFKFQIIDLQKDQNKILKTVDCNNKYKSKNWALLNDGEIEYITQERGYSKIQRIKV